MANKNVEQFIESYGPVAQQVSKEIKVDPNVLLGQWGLESRWGQSEMAKKYHNLGGIKDFSGTGHEAKDSKTGSMDKYVKFEDPEVFGMYYADQIKRNFPQALNTGPDIGAFTRGLASGKRGSYFGVSPEEYEKTLTSFQSAIPEAKALPFEGGEGKAAEAAGTAEAGEEETDEQREARMQADMDAQEKRQAQLIGAGAGAGVSTTKAAGAGVGAALEAGAKRVGQGFSTGMQGRPPVVPPTPSVGVSGPSGPGATSSPGTVRQPIPSGGPDAGRLASGQTGTMPYNYAKSAGLTDIEAGRALDMTKNAGGVHDLTSQRREGLNKIQSLFPGETYVENPRFSGIMTPDQGVGKGPKQSFRVQGALPAADLPPNYMPGPAAPPPQGALVQLPPRQAIPNTPMPLKGPSGLETVTNMFKGMMRPVAAAVSTVGKYVLPPLALASAAGEGVNIAQQARKPEGQRDTTGMALSGANILGSGMSMFPPTAPVGVPLMLGTSATQAYRDNPDFQEYVKRKMQGLSDTPLLNEMTGPLP
jgi:hypothetical protein